MIAESVVQKLVYIHAGFGGIALLFGGIALFVKKGGKLHKASGKVFFYSMLFSALTALIISILPQHENPFLFTIGVFSAYFIITGYLALRFKKPAPKLVADQIISIIMVLTGLGMIFYPVLLTQKLNIVLTAFGLVGIIFAVKDLWLFRNPTELKKSWLKLHLGKMIGGYIAATTAFLVVNNVFPGIIGWLAPGVIGGFYIAYWSRKVSPNKKK